MIFREVDKERRSLIIVYTRTGTKKGISVEKRCNNYRCRKGYYYGFHRGKDNSKVFETDVLKNDFLLTTNQTALAVDYNWEIVLQIL